jgi:hypothetical protein
MFFFFQNKSFAQRTAGGTRIIAGAVEVAAPVAKNIYNRMRSRAAVSESIDRKVEEARPLVEKAVPIVRKGFVIGKNILKILKKILR